MRIGAPDAADYDRFCTFPSKEERYSMRSIHRPDTRSDDGCGNPEQAGIMTEQSPFDIRRKAQKQVHGHDLVRLPRQAQI